jgi:O-antigen/teichoic acid export membrane protein
VLSRLRTGIALNLVAGAFSQGSTFVLNLITANLLGRYAFGEFTVVQGTLSTIGALAQVATGYTATKYVAEFRDSDPQKAARILYLCGIVSTVTACLATAGLALATPLIATKVFGTPALSHWLRIASPAVLFIVMNGYRSGALAGLESYAAIARTGVISGIIYIVLGFIGTRAGGVTGALIAITLSGGAQWVILGYFLRKELTEQNLLIRPTHPWRERDALVHFALPASLTGFITLPLFWLASAFLVRQPGGMDQIALFGAANSFRLIVLFLPNTMTSVGMSLLNNQRTASDAGYRRLFWYNLALTAACVTIAAAVMAALGPWLLHAFGREFTGGYVVLRVLMLTAVVEALAVWTYQLIQSHGRMWLTLLLITFPRDCVIVGLSSVLTREYGAAGLAAAHMSGWLLALIVIALLTQRLGLTPVTAISPARLSPAPSEMAGP